MDGIKQDFHESKRHRGCDWRWTSRGASGRGISTTVSRSITAQAGAIQKK